MNIDVRFVKDQFFILNYSLMFPTDEILFASRRRLLTNINKSIVFSSHAWIPQTIFDLYQKRKKNNNNNLYLSFQRENFEEPADDFSHRMEIIFFGKVFDRTIEERNSSVVKRRIIC